MPSTFPTRAKVGPIDYRIVEMNDHDSQERASYGLHIGWRQLIRVQTEGISLQKQAHTLIHELMHACYVVWKIEDGHDEEATISRLSLAMAAIWRDNPEIVHWISDALWGEPVVPWAGSDLHPAYRDR